MTSLNQQIPSIRILFSKKIPTKDQGHNCKNREKQYRITKKSIFRLFTKKDLPDRLEVSLSAP